MAVDLKGRGMVNIDDAETTGMAGTSDAVGHRLPPLRLVSSQFLLRNMMEQLMCERTIGLFERARPICGMERFEDADRCSSYPTI